MCGQRYCLENGIVTVHVGESVITANVHDQYTGFVNPMAKISVATKSNRRHVPDGATALICEVPEAIQQKYGVSGTETVRFVERTEKPFDLVKFENVEKPVPLHEFGFNVRLDILSLKDEPAPNPDPPSNKAATTRTRQVMTALTHALQTILPI